MRVIAAITGAFSIIMFIFMMLMLIIIDQPVATTLEIKGYGLMLITLPIIGLGLVLAAYEEMNDE